MYQLIYYSVASLSLNKDDISDILAISQKNNTKNNITGCMLHYNDAFIQILEGDQEIVDLLFAKIEQDKRHYNVKLVFNENQEERLFKNWSMAFVDLNGNDAAQKGKLTLRKDFVIIANQTGSSGVASELFWNIADELIND